MWAALSSKALSNLFTCINELTKVLTLCWIICAYCTCELIYELSFFFPDENVLFLKQEKSHSPSHCRRLYWLRILTPSFDHPHAQATFTYELRNANFHFTLILCSMHYEFCWSLSEQYNNPKHVSATALDVCFEFANVDWFRCCPALQRQ